MLGWWRFLAWWAPPSLGGPRNVPRPVILSLRAACGQGRGPAVMDTAAPSGMCTSGRGARLPGPCRDHNHLLAAGSPCSSELRPGGLSAGDQQRTEGNLRKFRRVADAATHVTSRVLSLLREERAAKRWSGQTLRGCGFCCCHRPLGLFWVLPSSRLPPRPPCVALIALEINKASPTTRRLHRPHQSFVVGDYFFPRSFCCLHLGQDWGSRSRGGSRAWGFVSPISFPRPSSKGWSLKRAEAGAARASG